MNSAGGGWFVNASLQLIASTSNGKAQFYRSDVLSIDTLNVGRYTNLSDPSTQLLTLVQNDGSIYLNDDGLVNIASAKTSVKSDGSATFKGTVTFDGSAVGEGIAIERNKPSLFKSNNNRRL